MNVSELRREYSRARLDEASTAADPLAQFQSWLDEAVGAGIVEPNAMTLATAGANGRPSARIVLLKGVDAEGLLFYTDFRSRKAQELRDNSQAAIVFHWVELERQVRAVCRVAEIDRATVWEYFRSRPEGSRIGAWASHQSAALPDRAVLDAEVAKVAAEFAGKEIPLPPHWGGFRLIPDEMEFWQGRPSRLHDRIQYTRTLDKQWHRVRLSP